VRKRCSSNADCTGVPCITDFVCDTGENTDKECRPNPPYGGPTQQFGNPSIDCPSTAAVLGTIDILFNPATSGTTTLLPSQVCNDVIAPGQECLGGDNDGTTCTNSSECPSGFCGPRPYAHRTCQAGDAANIGRPCQVNTDCAAVGGNCAFQCFCPSGGGVAQKPNDCDPACVGGANDAASCIVDSECPGGFCHWSDCRLNPGDPTNPEDGICTTGPTLSTCSITTFRTCGVDNDCRTPACTFCDPGNTETCETNFRQCFVNTGIVRTGVAGVPDGKAASTFCITPTVPAVDTVAGLPGPGALITPQTRLETGF
jgi:hypothetical protein